MPDEPEGFSLDEKAIDAIADKVAKRLRPKEPAPWDKQTERRVKERRTPKEPPKPPNKKVGGLITYKGD